MSGKSIPYQRKSASRTEPAESMRATTPRTVSSNRSPLLPTSLEALLLAIYPGTLLLGSLFSLLEPHARNAPYSAVTQSHPSEVAPSYFAQKKNLFNVFFVKIGWFWTTFAFLVFLFLHSSTGPRKTLVLTPRRAQGVLRWGMMTFWWAIFTQWFFGPPLIDRGFRWTGGQCELIRTEEGRSDMSDTRELFTGAACKLAGGQWKGGHDISGHVFLLVLGSAFLWMEILPVVLRHAGLTEERLVRKANGEVTSVKVEVQGAGDVENKENEKDGKGGVGVPLAVAGLSWWMLLMTAAYFHTWFEKVFPLFQISIRRSR